MGKRHHKYDYFSAFESLSELAVDEADLLIKAIEEFSTADALKETMEKAHAIEHKGDDINHDIFRNVATDFITPIDREDIIGLAQALDTIIDELEEVIQHPRFTHHRLREHHARDGVVAHLRAHGELRGRDRARRRLHEYHPVEERVTHRYSAQRDDG